MKFKKLCLFVCSGFIFLQSHTSALNPSYTQDLTEENKFYINSNGGISHNTYVIEKDGRKFFFKETKRKLSMYDTAKRAITEYFGKKYISDQKSMLKSLTNEENLKKFIYIKTYDDGQAAKWLQSEDKSDTSVLGFTGYLSNEFKNKVLPKFLHYAFSEFVQYRANRNRDIGDLQLNQLIGSLSTMRMAKLLGVSDLVVKTDYIKLTKPNMDSKLGIIMDCAQGISFKQAKAKTNRNITPLFQKELSKLLIFDVICAQRDRSVNNYFVKLSGNDIVGLNAYDNDLAFDVYSDLKVDNFILPAIVNDDGLLKIPHMDKDFASRILNLKNDDIIQNLKDLLDKDRISATIKRVEQLQEAIKNTMRSRVDFLLNSSEWSSITVQEELSIDGNSYLKQFLKKLNS